MCAGGLFHTFYGLSISSFDIGLEHDCIVIYIEFQVFWWNQIRHWRISQGLWRSCIRMFEECSNLPCENKGG